VRRSLGSVARWNAHPGRWSKTIDTQIYTSYYHGWTITVKWKLGAGYVAVIDDGLDDQRVVERAYSVREAKEFAIEDIDRMEALGEPFKGS
jgi:hypothetical protein